MNESRNPFAASQKDMQVIPVEYVRLMRQLVKEPPREYSTEELQQMAAMFQTAPSRNQ